MSVLDSGLARLVEVGRFRRGAQTRAGQAWRDVVFQRFGQRHLDPLEQAELKLQVALQRGSQTIDQALREL